VRKLNVRAYGLDEPIRNVGPQLPLWPDLEKKIWPALTRDVNTVTKIPNKTTLRELVKQRKEDARVEKEVEKINQLEKERWDNIKKTIVSDLTESVKKAKHPDLKKLRFSIRTVKYKGPFERNLFTTGVSFDLNIFNAPDDKELRKTLDRDIMEVIDRYAPPDHQNRREFYPKIVFK